MRGKGKGLLENIVVLDLADETASFCSKLLADLGASVIKIEKPGGDPSRNLDPIHQPDSDPGSCGLFFAYHNSNKQGFMLDLRKQQDKRIFSRLIQTSDVLVETCPRRSLPNLGFGRKRLSSLNPLLIHISITGFGRTGPKSRYRSSDSVSSAFGGQMCLSGAPSGPPVELFGKQTYFATALFGAVAILLSLRKRRIEGRGCYVDLSSQEAVASTLDHVMVDYWRDGIIAGRQGNSEYKNLSSILPCKDGYIEITILQNWETLLGLMAAEGKAEDLLGEEWQKAAYRENNYDRILKTVEKWTRRHAKAELFELGQAMHFPWAPVYSPREVLASPQLKARRFLVNTPLPEAGVAIPYPGLPYKFSSYSPSALHPAPQLNEHSRTILQKLNTVRESHKPILRNTRKFEPPNKTLQGLCGTRVVDLTRVLSGPYATRILADFGFEVIKIQSTRTAHGTEQNDSAYFNTWNRNKKSVTLNLDFPEARDIFLKLVAISDVVVENFSSRVMGNWGLNYERLRKVKPDLVMASISAMGHTGPWKDFVGYGTTFQALSGLTAMTSRMLDAPVRLGHAYGDIITGLYAAISILAALEYRDYTGKGQFIDLSGYEALCALLGPTLMRAALESKQEIGKQQDSDLNAAAPRGCYPCRGDDRWCVLTVSSQEEYRAFCRITGDPELRAVRFSTIEKRKKNRAQLDALITRWTSSHKAEFIVPRLQQAGIAAGIVQNADDVAKDRHLAARRFFVALEHPLIGKTFSDRSALGCCTQKPKNWKAAPLLGQDNREVLIGWLGLSDAEFLSLAARGIIG